MSSVQEGSVLVPLADGFEELEAVAIVDVLRRAGLPVFVGGLVAGPVRGAHGITVATDGTLDDVQAEQLAALVLPGGMPGTTNLLEDERVLALVRAVHAAGRPTAAICAAPMVLAAAGILNGKEATSHPSVRTQLGGATILERARVVRDGNVWTSQGPGTALEFALALVEELVGPERRQELAKAMVTPGA